MVVSDNLRSGITKACFYEPAVNRTYAEMAAHYNTAIVPAAPKAADAYESLRATALCGEPAACPGLGILRRQGMAAWMRALAHPQIVAKVDSLIDNHCDREIAQPTVLLARRIERGHRRTLSADQYPRIAPSRCKPSRSVR